MTRIFLKILLKRRKSADIGRAQRDYIESDKRKKIYKKALKINILNVSDYKKGKQNEVSHSVIDNQQILEEQHAADIVVFKNGMIHYRKSKFMEKYTTMEKIVIDEKEQKSSFPDFSTHYSK